MKLLLYCTKQPPYLSVSQKTGIITGDYIQTQVEIVNGKIVAECDFEVEEITSKNLVSLEKGSCLDKVSILKYLKPNLIWDNDFKTLLNTFGGLTIGYAIHIKNLHIFDEPRELIDYYSENDTSLSPIAKNLRKAPQNMMKVFDWLGDYYILISIHPEWLCKILNGEKTIEVRKKALKEMLKND